MTRKVFLSYAAQDRAFARAIESRLGDLLAASDPIDVVDVQASLPEGGDARRAIRSAMNESDAVVIVESPDVERSPWVNYEAGMADALGKPVVFVGRKGSGKSVVRQRFPESTRFIELDEAS